MSEKSLVRAFSGFLIIMAAAVTVSLVGLRPPSNGTNGTTPNDLPVWLNEFHSGRSLPVHGYFYARTMSFAEINLDGTITPRGEEGSRPDLGAMDESDLQTVINDVASQGRTLVLGLWVYNFETLSATATKNFLTRLSNKLAVAGIECIWLPAWEFNQDVPGVPYWGEGIAGSARDWYIVPDTYNNQMAMIRNARDSLGITNVLIASQPDARFARCYEDGWYGENDPNPYDIHGQRMMMNYREGINQADVLGCSMYVCTYDRSTSPWTKVDQALSDKQIILDAFDWMHKMRDYVDSTNSKPFIAFEYNSMSVEGRTNANDFFIQTTYDQVPDNFLWGLRGISWYLGFSKSSSWATASNLADAYDGYDGYGI